jgi:hypothetical protein
MQPVIITARRNDASLIARLELDPTPDRIIGDDVLDRVACILNGNAANLNVASLEVFPPALIAARADLLPGWKRTPLNIAGNFCFSRPQAGTDPYWLDGLRSAIGSGFAAQDAGTASEPVSEPVSGSISEAISEAESADDFVLPDLDDTAVKDQVLDLLINLQSPAAKLEQQRLLAAVYNKLYNEWTANGPNAQAVAVTGALEALGWDLIAEAHEPCDEPFWTIIAKRRQPVFPAAPYVVCDYDFSGISNGHYDLSRERAFRVFSDKIAAREEV